MIGIRKKTISRLLGAKTSVLVVSVVFAVYITSSFDMCTFASPLDKGFVFSSSWTEHLHSSEEYAVYYQTSAFYQGRNWLTKGTIPEYSVDSVKIGNYYYAIAEPVTAALLLPFYTLGKLLMDNSYLIRSVMIGMIFYTCISALLVRKISLQLNQSSITANLAPLLFGLTTLAFSYSRLLYPQPVVTMLMLFALVFLLKYKTSRKLTFLFCSALFYALTVLSFNAFIITAPFFLYYLGNNEIPKKTKELYAIGLGLLPSIILFLIWNSTTTGNPLATPRQMVFSAPSFQILYSTASGTWLNVEGLIGSLFSPVGIFFVSPILFAVILTFLSFKSKAKNETILLTSIAVVFWLFMSFTTLGDAGRDFWVGGWANIARYMYIPSTVLIIFAAAAFEKINKTKNLLGAWILSLMIVFSFLANLSYGIRHDLMIQLLKDFPSTSLLVWFHTLEPIQIDLLAIAIILFSLVYPAYIFLKKNAVSLVDISE